MSLHWFLVLAICTLNLCVVLDMFWSQPFNESQAEQECIDQWGVKPRPLWATVQYVSFHWETLDYISYIAVCLFAKQPFHSFDMGVAQRI